MWIGSLRGTLEDHYFPVNPNEKFSVRRIGFGRPPAVQIRKNAMRFIATVYTV